MNFKRNPKGKPANLADTRYRADIDGLRAIAILSVIGFHFFPGFIKGGFIGVDIFFVISGFLISGIIFRSLENNSFSFVEFYMRRARRIFPALVFLLAVCLLLGWFVLLADEYKQLGGHVAAGAGFVSNLILWFESGYFDNASGTKPLLHLWSLGIEEQFYIFWPLLLGIVWKWKHNYIFITLFIAAASFAVNIYTVESNPVASFYSPFSRFWELMIGGVLAYLTHKSLYLDHKKNWQSFMGVLLIVLGLLFISIEKSFPGWWALLPTAGTFFLISAGPTSWLNRNLLGNRVLVWFGLISYPLYLWHWTLLSFARIIEEKTPSYEIRIALIIISIGLAWFTYKLIEQPIRHGKYQKTMVGSLCLLMIIIGLAGYNIYRQHGIESRASVVAFKNMTENLVYLNHWSDWSLCKGEGKSQYCRILIPSRPPDIAVIGDSHAGHLGSGLSAYFGKRNENVVVRLVAGCMPFYSITMNNRKFHQCERNIINKALERAISSPSIKTIILAGYANLAIYGRVDAATNFESYEIGYTSTFSDQSVDQNLKAFKQAMHVTLEKLARSGKKIIFLVDTPELYFNPRECITLRTFTLPFQKLREPCSMDRKLFEQRTSEYHQLVEEAEGKFRAVKFIHTYGYLCNESACDVLVDNNLIYSTRDHLSVYGSRYLIDKISGELD